jgi:carboxylesterase type B
MQRSLSISTEPYTHEDCLFLNVNTPQIDGSEEKAMPVMVFIHGGGFFLGSSSKRSYGEGKFMDHEVLLVTFNYRLNVFGFLSTDDAESPGNYGLWDQQLALQWVQDNIRSFGGDPTRVTIFGESAGATSVGFHMLSPHSKGLFHAGIMQSGSPTCDWTVQENPLSHALNIAKQVNCPVKSTADMVQCLRSKSSEELLQAYVTAYAGEHMFTSTITFVPVVERAGESRFLSDKPMSLLKRGKFNRVPVIGGVMKNEGVLLYKPNHEIPLEERVGGFLVRVTHYTDTTKHPEVIETIMKEYFREKNISDHHVCDAAALQLIADQMFVSGNEQFMTSVADQGVPAYMYVMSYVGNTVSLTKLVHGSKVSETAEKLFELLPENIVAFVKTYALRLMTLVADMGDAGHADELPYLFDSVLSTTMNEQDHVISQRLLAMWTSLAKTGTPTPQVSSLVPVLWPQLKKGDTTYLQIDKDLKILSSYKPDKVRFWNTVLPKIASR